MRFCLGELKVFIWLIVIDKFICWWKLNFNVRDLVMVVMKGFDIVIEFIRKLLM